VVVVLSYSGETDEVKHLIPFVKKIGAKIIAITGRDTSSLARHANGVISVKVDKEACPLGLAPTTSTTAMLAVCDALSVVLQKMKGFKQKDFAFFHPRGSLGRKLLLRVKDAMRTRKYNPVVTENALIKDVLLKITTLHAGAASVADGRGRLVGIFTDGDLRRNLEKYPHPDKWKRLMDKLIYVIVFVGPIMTIPQVYNIWIEKNASGVSLISWTTYLFTAVFWLIYAVMHKEKPLILPSIIWIILEILIILGIVIHG